jgi:hypothetical protein
VYGLNPFKLVIDAFEWEGRRIELAPELYGKRGTEQHWPGWNEEKITLAESELI